MADLTVPDGARPVGDEVDAAREWLRRHGVDPGPPSAGVRQTSRQPGTGHAEETRELGGPHDRGGSGGMAGLGDLGGGAEDLGGAEDGVGPGGRGSRRGHRADRRRTTSVGSTAGGRGAQRPAAGSPELDPDADPEEVARRIVLNKLAAQARTRAELERALQRKAVPTEAAATVLDRMVEVGLVDDATFAQDWVASRQQRRHLSRTALRRELQTKGVDREVIDDALGTVDVSDEHRAALDLARRRAAPMAALPREVAYRRLGGVLARRGFSSSVTARVLSEVLDVRELDGHALDDDADDGAGVARR